MGFIINGETVADEVLEQEFESIKEHYQSQGEVVCCDRDDEFWGYAKDNVINRTLLEQESKERFGPVDEAAVVARFEALKSEHGSDAEFYDNTGFNPGDEKMLIEKLRSSMAVDRVLESEIGDEAPATEAELQAYYEETIDRYMSPEEVRVSQIFVEPSSHEAAREAFLKLRDLRREILAGKDFDEAARENNSEEEREIDLGYMKQGETMPEVEAITFSMEPDEVSPVVATNYGFHIFKVTGHKAPAPVPIEEVTNLEEQFLVDRKNRAIGDVIELLKAKGTVEETPVEVS